jgi:hypothetical protein
MDMADQTTTSDEYVPGTCNIGAVDARARARVGWAGVAATVALAGGVLAIGAHPAWMLAAAVPAYVAAIGLLQARSRFCVGYAAAGRYGFGSSRGPTGAVADDEHRAADVARARRINALAARWTIVVAAALVVVAALVG